MPRGVVAPTKLAMPVSTVSPVYSPAIGRQSLPCTRVPCTSCRRSTARIASSMYAGWPSSTTSTALLPVQNSTISSGTSG